MSSQPAKGFFDFVSELEDRQESSIPTDAEIVLTREHDDLPPAIDPSLDKASSTSPPPEDRMPNTIASIAKEKEQELPEQPKWASRDPVPNISPCSSLPPWKYISPRATSEIVRPPSAMAHRASTPLPQTPDGSRPRPRTPTPAPRELLDEHGLHGRTTYTSMPLEQSDLDPANPGHARILAASEEMPMSGWYLSSSEAKRGFRGQVAMYSDYFWEDTEQLQELCEDEWKLRLNRLPGQWAAYLAQGGVNPSPQMKAT